jgi:hypothetical protein
MGRTKTQPSSKKKSNLKEGKRLQTTGSASSSTANTYTPCKTRTKPLTMKQLMHRKMVIFQTIKEANKLHEAEKNKYLTSSKTKPKKIIKFNKLIEFSTGEKIITEFSENSSQSDLVLIETSPKDYDSNKMVDENEVEMKNSKVSKSGKKSKKVIISKNEMKIEKENVDKGNSSKKKGTPKS